jgi:hypothetical protein
MGSDEYKVCISGHTLSKKLDNLNLQKAVMSIALHGLAHKAGADENEARAIEYLSYYFSDQTVERVAGNLETAVFQANENKNRMEDLLSHIEGLGEIAYYKNETTFMGENSSEAREINGIKKTVGELEKAIDLYKKTISIIEARLSKIEESGEDKLNEKSDLEEQLRDVKQSFASGIKSLNQHTSFLKYLESGNILGEFAQTYICRDIDNTNDFFGNGMSMELSERFIYGADENLLLFEIFALMNDIKNMGFCLNVSLGLSISEFLHENLNVPVYGVLGESISKFINEDFGDQYSSADFRESVKLMFDVNDEALDKKFILTRPGHKGDVVTAIKELSRLYGDLSLLLEDAAK